MRKISGLSALFAAALCATAAVAEDYKVIMSFTSEDLYDGERSVVGIPVESHEINPRPDFMAIDFRTYTLLAADDKGEGVVCAGLKIMPENGTPLDFTTRSKEAYLYLAPAKAPAPVRSYGGCRKVAVPARWEFNNAFVNVRKQGLPYGSSITVPILGTDDPLSPRFMFDMIKHKAVDLQTLSVSTKPCPHAGFNETHAKAKKDDRISVGFCPRL